MTPKAHLCGVTDQGGNYYSLEFLLGKGFGANDVKAMKLKTCPSCSSKATRPPGTQFGHHQQSRRLDE